MFLRIFNSKSKTVTFSAFLLGSSIFISRLLGLVRDRLLADRFGAGEQLDIYFVAFRIPDFVYGILIMGGISTVFLPIFSEYFKEKEEKAWQFANNLLNCFLVLLLFLCGILALFTPFLINLIAPGFGSENKEIAVNLTRIMFLSPIFFGISSIFSGILQYFERFLAYSLAPILYNLGIIFGIVFLFDYFGMNGLAYGVVLGAFLHFLIQLPIAKKSGYKYLSLLNFKNFGLTKVFKLMVPRTIGATAYHFNLIVITAIASTLAVGSIAIFNFANNLQYFPIGLIGVSFAVASFPMLSKSWVNNNKEEFANVFSSVFQQILFLILPLSFLIFILRAQIVRIILGTGEFGWWETMLTAASLGIFAISIFAFSFISFLAKTFYSMQDTKTPVLISLVSIAINIGLCFLFINLLNQGTSFHDFMARFLKIDRLEDIRVIGLPLALSISGIIQFSLLMIFLKKKVSFLKFDQILKSFVKILLASFCLLLSGYFSLLMAAKFLNTDTFFGILIQTGIAFFIGLIVYILMALFLKIDEIKIIWSAIWSQLVKIKNII